MAETGVLCNEATLTVTGDEVAHVGDTVDVAFLALGGMLGIDRKGLIADRPLLGMIPYDTGGFVVASSPEEELTELTRRDAQQSVIWQVSLPGRLSAGPYVGPSGEIYLATCRGWDCGPPHLLIAVTGTIQEESP